MALFSNWTSRKHFTEFPVTSNFSLLDARGFGQKQIFFAKRFCSNKIWTFINGSLVVWFCPKESPREGKTHHLFFPNASSRIFASLLSRSVEWDLICWVGKTPWLGNLLLLQSVNDILLHYKAKEHTILFWIVDMIFYKFW